MISKYCIHCGAKNTFETTPKFCSQCGSAFNKSAASSTASTTSQDSEPQSKKPIGSGDVGAEAILDNGQLGERFGAAVGVNQDPNYNRKQSFRPQWQVEGRALEANMMDCRFNGTSKTPKGQD